MMFSHVVLLCFRSSTVLVSLGIVPSRSKPLWLLDSLRFDLNLVCNHIVIVLLGARSVTEAGDPMIPM